MKVTDVPRGGVLELGVSTGVVAGTTRKLRAAWTVRPLASVATRVTV